MFQQKEGWVLFVHITSSSEVVFARVHLLGCMWAELREIYQTQPTPLTFGPDPDEEKDPVSHSRHL